MKAMILAAGRGQRMGALTDELPKPLLEVAGLPLIERLIKRLAAAGVTELVINLAWQGEKIRAYLGDGRRWGVTIEWSNEGDLPTGTAAGVRRALPLLGEQSFLLINSDLVSDIDFAALILTPLAQLQTAHLLLVDNPDHHPLGDFQLAQGRLVTEGGERLTYSGCGVFNPALIQNSAEVELGPLLLRALNRGEVITAQRHAGYWLDVGTPERLLLAQQRFESEAGFPPARE